MKEHYILNEISSEKTVTKLPVETGRPDRSGNPDRIKADVNYSNSSADSFRTKKTYSSRIYSDFDYAVATDDDPDIFLVDDDEDDFDLDLMDDDLEEEYDESDDDFEIIDIIFEMDDEDDDDVEDDDLDDLIFLDSDVDEEDEEDDAGIEDSDGSNELN